jgi:hypothetical protein
MSRASISSIRPGTATTPFGFDSATGDVTCPEATSGATGAWSCAGSSAGASVPGISAGAEGGASTGLVGIAPGACTLPPHPAKTNATSKHLKKKSITASDSGNGAPGNFFAVSGYRRM